MKGNLVLSKETKAICKNISLTLDMIIYLSVITDNSLFWFIDFYKAFDTIKGAVSKISILANFLSVLDSSH